MKQVLLVTTCLILLASLPCAKAQMANRSVPSIELDGPNGELNLGMQLYVGLQFNSADMVALLFRKAREQPRTTDGRSSIAAIYIGYGDTVAREMQWDEHLMQIHQWQAREPDNAHAVLAEGAYWIAYGRFARGGGFAASVPQRAFELMHERMARAQTVLDTIKPLAAEHPVWYVEMLTIALLDGWDVKRRLALFTEAMHADPYLYASYSRMATSLTPRWGGSLSEYHAFVESSVARTRQREGNSYYALLYWNLADIESNQEAFHELGIPWQKMKSGFDDLIERYPDSQWNLHHYANFACRAGDGATFNKLRPKLDMRKVFQMQPIWKNAYTLEFCTDQFTRRT